MLNSFLLRIRFRILLFSGHPQVVLENTVLRHQLAVFMREKKATTMRDRDRRFWMAVKKRSTEWKSALVFVQPETVTGWQRNTGLVWERATAIVQPSYEERSLADHHEVARIRGS